MMKEILKPLLDNDVLTEEIKTSIETALTEAFAAKEQSVRTEVEDTAKKNFGAAKSKFEETFKTLEESYKTKLTASKAINDTAKEEISELVAKIEELETKPFVNISESDLEAAEAKLVTEVNSKNKVTVDTMTEKFNETYELISETHAELVEGLSGELTEAQTEIASLVEQIEGLESELEKTEGLESEMEEKISEAVNATEQRMIVEADEKVETLKQHLVTSTEIFLEQELGEIKADKEEIMKETVGRELLESLKTVVKQHWDVDSEVAEEILEMKKESEAKVEQYKDMLKKEHSRLEESQGAVESLKKKVIVDAKASVLTDEKKKALEKLAENIESGELETQIDGLMESVIDTFNSGFDKAVVEEKTEKTEKKEEVLVESTISSGDTVKMSGSSIEMSQLLEYAGIKN